MRDSLIGGFDVPVRASMGFSLQGVEEGLRFAVLGFRVKPRSQRVPHTLPLWN